MKVNKNFAKFCDEFNIVDNALDMRTLIRWNGRDLMRKENLSEHTHLVVACVMHLVKYLNDVYGIDVSHVEKDAMKIAVLHDSLEILRGDILSITKDNIEGLKEVVDREEAQFMSRMLGPTEPLVKDVVYLADLMACYKFLEWELKFPSNDFCKQAYVDCKRKYDNALENFLTKMLGKKQDTGIVEQRFVKGYFEDAGVDIILDRDVTFLPMSTTTFDLNMHIVPNEGEMGLLCARTGAAARGLSVAMCPIDPNFSGDWTAIVHNVSNEIIEYKKGESFCQYVMIKMIRQSAPVKKPGKRSQSKLGGTDKC